MKFSDLLTSPYFTKTNDTVDGIDYYDVTNGYEVTYVGTDESVNRLEVHTEGEYSDPACVGKGVVVLDRNQYYDWHEVVELDADVTLSVRKVEITEIGII